MIVRMPSPRIVLLRPRNADNLGAIARAMQNFGLHDWVLVDANPRLLTDGARLAVGADDLLAAARHANTLADAVADCSWVVGTTMRMRPGQRRLTPRQLAAAADARSDQRWALVFGDERAGMTNDDLAQCHAVSFIPTHAAQPSLNLAQAVLVYAYELAIAERGAPHPPQPNKADDRSLRRLAAAFDDGLVACGFAGAGAARHAVADLIGSLHRAALTEHEAELWLAAISAMSKGVRRERRPDDGR